MMSGGAFDYLYLRAGNIMGGPDEYERMAQSLESIGEHDAAARTRELATHIEAARKLSYELRLVHRAEEWRVSGDLSEQHVHDICATLPPRGVRSSGD